MVKWPFGKKARAERAAEESRQLAEEEALDAEIEELLQESEALERGELPARGPGSSREYKSEGLPEGAAELLVAMGRAGRTLVTLRTRERVLQLLRAHPESEALANPIAQLGTGILRCRVALGLLPPDTAIPLLQLDASVNNPSSAADTRGIILMEIELVFMQAELNFDLANTAADSEPLSRVEKIVEGYQQFFEGCSGLDRNASRILRLAAMQDLAGASEAAVANSWTDETSFAADPLGQLWPEGMSVAGVEAEQVPETASVGIEALLAERLGMHRDRMLAVDHPDQDFIREALAEDDIALFAGFAAEKMRLTLADGEVHSTLIAGSPVAVVIYTIKGTVGEAAAWYEENHGGYTMMMDTFMQGPEVVASGAEVLCHLTFGHTGDDAWVNLTFMPLSGDRFRKVPIIAMDLLSEAEKAQHGFA